MPEKIIGFSKLSREDKIAWISSNFLDDSIEFKNILNEYLNTDTEVQALHNSFSENSISNFYLPYSVSPNFLINSKNFLNNSNEFESILNKYLNDDKEIQSIHNSLSENAISNFHLPYSISVSYTHLTLPTILLV